MMKGTLLLGSFALLYLLIFISSPYAEYLIEPSIAAPNADSISKKDEASFFRAFNEEDLFKAEQIFHRSIEIRQGQNGSSVLAAQALVFARYQAFQPSLDLIRDNRLTDKSNLSSEALVNLVLASYLSKDKNLGALFLDKLRKAAPNKSITECLTLLIATPYTVLDADEKVRKNLKKLNSIDWGSESETSKILLAKLTASYQTLNSEAAYRTMQDILRKKGSDSAVLIICAENLRKQARYLEAIKLLDKLLAAKGKHWWGRELRARINMDLNEAGPAIADCKILLKQATSEVERKHILGLMSRIYERASDYYNAYKAQSQLLKQRPDIRTGTGIDPVASRELARSSPKLLLQKGELAVKCLDKLNQLELSEVATDMEALLYYKRTNLSALFVLASAQRKLGSYDKALKNINLGLAEQPDYGPWYEERAKVWQALGKSEQSKRDLLKAKSLR